jgi:organic hydroperoxide reductase OsmC/OhrA
MSEHTVGVRWRRDDRTPEEFARARYSRAHTWTFDGGASVAASASPHVVAPPYSDARAVDPEEAFVASVSSCHMLWFLHIAANAGFVVDSYDDEAVGALEKDGDGKLAITRITLRPHTKFAGTTPDNPRLQALHQQAHAACFISNSIRTVITVQPRS